MKLIKLSDTHYIVVDDSEIKDCYYYNSLDKAIRFGNNLNHPYHHKIIYSTENFGAGCQQKVMQLSLSEVEEAINGYDVEKMALQDFKDNDDGFISFQDRIEGFVAGFETHQELVKDNSFAIEILDDIQKDLANYQNEIGIGTIDDVQWQQTFVDRVIASITSYESFSTKTEWDIEIVDGKIKLL